MTVKEYNITVQELIEQLTTCDNKDLHVFVWIEGIREPISMVDPCDDCVDLNIITPIKGQ